MGPDRFIAIAVVAQVGGVAVSGSKRGESDWRRGAVADGEGPYVI